MPHQLKNKTAFSELQEKQSIAITKWADLIIEEIYQVDDSRLVETEYGESLVLKLDDGTEVLKKRIKEGVYPFFLD